MGKFLFSHTPKGDLSGDASQEKNWNILVVDDEQAIHDVTRLALRNVVFEGQGLKIYSAFSSEEARVLLMSDEHIFCMVFVDVIMETNDAGLKLVDWIRSDLKNRAIRLILRTGQAGFAPEDEVITRYDINDYKTKTELTAQKLKTCVYSAIRGYRDIQTIGRSLDSFQNLVQSSTNILKVDNLQSLATAAFDNLLSLMNIDCSSVYISRHETDAYDEMKETVLSCTGRFKLDVDQKKHSFPEHVLQQMDEVFCNKKNVLTDHCYIGFFRTGRKSESVLYIEFERKPTSFNAHMIELFSTQAALIVENLSRQEQLDDSQRELLYIVGDAIEARSRETGKHVKRVSLICELIAKEMQLSKDFVTAIKVAAPLHDLGKISIPEKILHKPGKLDDSEWEIMKTHAAAGATILDRSNLTVAKMGARLAKGHHENWDGSGYPNGLEGLDIPVEARIMAIADVLDALGAKRSYKEPWPSEEILKFIRQEKGKKFDPDITEIVIDNFSEIMKIRDEFPD